VAKVLDIATWRLATPDDVLELYESRKKTRKPDNGLGYLVVRSQLRPIDIYAYLRARFGKPNGFQNFLRRDDSDNWIHWDFNLKADNIDIHIAGTSREIHFLIGESLTDQEWKEVITNLKADFERLGPEKSEIIRSFEKFVIFQNKFSTLAELCAELHESILKTPKIRLRQPDFKADSHREKYETSMNRQSKRATRLYGDCLKLKLLTPIMAEAFINLVILVFCKDDVRNNPQNYESFIRLNMPERLAGLSEYCFGFVKPINQETVAYRNFKRVMDKRNFAIHGNMNPVRDQIETVYFEGKRPIFAEGGDNIVKFFEHLETINSPQDVIADYENVHLYLFEITHYLSASHRAFFDHILDDPFPGYEVYKKRVTKILPNHNILGILEGTRYDDDLNVNW